MPSITRKKKESELVGENEGHRAGHADRSEITKHPGRQFKKPLLSLAESRGIFADKAAKSGKRVLCEQKRTGRLTLGNWQKMEELYYFCLFPLQFARFSGMLVAALWDGMQRPVLGCAVPVEN